MAFLDKFAENSNFFAARFGSPGPLLECMSRPQCTKPRIVFSNYIQFSRKMGLQNIYENDSAGVTPAPGCDAVDQL